MKDKINMNIYLPKSEDFEHIFNNIPSKSYYSNKDKWLNNKLKEIIPKWKWYIIKILRKFNIKYSFGYNIIEQHMAIGIIKVKINKRNKKLAEKTFFVNNK